MLSTLVLEISENSCRKVILQLHHVLKPVPVLPDVPPVPVIPSWITGRCVYGHIVTDDHTKNFRESHPDVPHGQSAYPVGLVSIASVLNSKGHRPAATARVYHEGEWRICLIHVDHNAFYPDKIADLRRSADFIAAIHKALGITEEPQWYACYIP